MVTTIRSPLAGVRCPAHHSPLTAQPRSHALRAAKQLAAHRSVPVAPAGSASLGSGVPPFPNASDQKLASYVVAASDQSLIDSRRSPGATRHLSPSLRTRSLLHGCARACSTLEVTTAAVADAVADDAEL